ncbi:hypothetical protein XI06_13370 [Bradyrhizobium sp. CCBAU 11434]|uniref:transporter substrate-binding domain-containing protein n=1 Tax=Bradyrhizobium sp. CCBAU 11434 TaxID=1630885 RepID=UPI002306BF5F|nr:transporter substrate-binding domain-containing protein [Bradyrhizobium sp. CCBAU 11434]MDA9521329.1 hypothetical protein [Bradyrhizobium sp. CCBAU 11434]
MRATTKLSLLVLLVTLTGYSLATSAQDDAPLFASIRKAGQVKVALASLPPYMIISPNGEAMGASVDLQNMVLKVMGQPSLTPVLMGWDAMSSGLLAYQFDYVGAGANISEAGCKVTLFSAPYYAAQAGLFVLPGNPKRLTSVAELARRPDIKITMLPSASTYQGYAAKQGVNPNQIMLVPDVQAGIAMVTGGRADAFVLGQFTIPDPEKKGLEVVVDHDTPVYGSGLVFRKEDKAFRDEFNKHLVVLLRNGTLQKLYEKYGIPNGEAQAQLLAKFSKASDLAPSCE